MAVSVFSGMKCRTARTGMKKGMKKARTRGYEKQYGKKGMKKCGHVVLTGRV